MGSSNEYSKKKSNLWVYLCISIALIFLIMYSTGGCSNSTPRGSYNRFIGDTGLVFSETGEIDHFETENYTKYEFDKYFGSVKVMESTLENTRIESVVQRNKTFYVLYYRAADGKRLSKFRNDPEKYADYYFHCDQDQLIGQILNAYNGTVSAQNETLRDHLYGIEHGKVRYWGNGVWAYDPAPSFDPDGSGPLTYADGNVFDPTAPYLGTTGIPYNSYVQFREYLNLNYLTPYIFIDPSEEPSSWFSMSNMLTMFTIILLVCIVFFVYRSLSSRSGIGLMGRNRATHTLGGNIRFENVAGIEEEKEELIEIVDFLKNPSKFLEMGARIPKGVLLFGQPGTGKTLLAKAIAGEAGVHFFSLSGSDFSEMLVGVGPSRMRDLFETAKANAPAIIFIDEIDSIARMRGVGVSGVSDENEQTLNQLLVQMDGFTKSEGVIVIAATNRPDVLDQALLRPGRFDRQIVIQIPDVKGREKILEVHAKGKPIGNDVDIKRVAQIISGFTGADIENLLNEAAIIAAKKDKRKINMSDITEGINKVLLGPQKKSRIITEDDKNITAYHEAGHAIVSRVLQPDQVVQEVSIIPRGMAAGYTLTNDENNSHSRSRTFLNARLAMLLAGRTAEQIFVGDMTTGASNDLKVATELAEKMVTMFGMSDKLGPLFYGKEEEIALRMANAQSPHSEALQSIIDSEIKSFILSAEKKAQEILKAEKSKVETMRKILLERETIYSNDILLIMDGKSAENIIKEMDKRDEQAKLQEKEDKITAEVEILNRDLEHILNHTKRFLQATVVGTNKDQRVKEAIAKLEKNFELARDYVRHGGRLSILPTIDNLETYGSILKGETKTDEKQTATPDGDTKKE